MMRSGSIRRLAQRLARSSRREDGSVIVLTAVCLTVLIGFAGMAIDIGGWYQNERKAQAVADAAALAGVQDLPGSPATATTEAQSYVTKNLLPGATAVVTTPYNSDASQIHVKVSDTSPSWFANLFGVSSVNVSAGATAKKIAGTATPAVFAKDSNCSNQSLTVNGSNITIVGATRSNGSIFGNADNSTFGATTYGGPNGCSVIPNGSGNTYAGASTPVRDATPSTWPLDYSVSPPACTYGNLTGYSSNFIFQTANQVIPPGVYCTSGAININASVSGNVTFIAGSFQTNGSFNFTPYAQGLLFYQTGSGNLQINASYLHGGTIFAPTALVTLQPSAGGSNSGSVEALDVNITASNWTFTGSGTGGTSGSSGALSQ